MSAIDAREKELVRALAALTDLARANFPRDTDLRVSVASASTATGSVVIPWTLLAKLIKEQHDG